MGATVTHRQVAFEMHARLKEYDLDTFDDLELVEMFFEGEQWVWNRLPPDAMFLLVKRDRIGPGSGNTLDGQSIPADMGYPLYILVETGLNVAGAGGSIDEGPPKMAYFAKPSDVWALGDYQAVFTEVDADSLSVARQSPLVTFRGQKFFANPAFSCDGTGGKGFEADLVYVRALDRSTITDLTVANEIGDQWLDLAISAGLVKVLRTHGAQRQEFGLIAKEMELYLAQMMEHARRAYAGVLRLSPAVTPSDPMPKLAPGPGASTYASRS